MTFQSCLSVAHDGLHSQTVVEDALAQAQILRRDLKKLVIGEEFEALLKAELSGRDEAQSLVRAGCAGIGQVLGAAHVDGDVIGLRADAHDHAGVDLRARGDEHRAALLSVPDAVGDRLAGLERYERACAAAGDIALVRLVLLKHGRHDALALGVGQELVAIAEESARRDEVAELYAVADGGHLDELALARAELLHNRAHIVRGNVDDDALDRLAGDAVYLLIQHARGGYLEFIALAAHGLNEDAQAHFAASCDVKRVGRAVNIGHAQGDVLERFADEAVAYLARGDELALAACKGAVVDGEGHFQRGSGYFDKRQGLGKALRAYRVAYRDVANAAHGNDIARAGLRYGNLGQTLELIKRHGLRLHGCRVRIVIVADLDLLILLDNAALDAAYCDAADIFVVVNARNEELEGAVEILLGCGNILEDGLEKGLEIGAGDLGGIARRALSAGAEEHGRVKLLIGRVKVHEKLKHLVNDLVDALVGAVDLVDDDDDSVTELKRARQDESRLRHRALGSVNEQDNAVDHLEDTLDLAAEVGVSRGIDDVYFRIAVAHGGVLCHDGYAALALKVVRVHDAVNYLLIFAVNAALLEHLVNERGLAVVNVRDDGNISEFLHLNSTPKQFIRFQHKNIF